MNPFTCTICNTSFTHKTRLMSHERFHSREKSAPLATQSNNLLRYCGMLHSGVKRYTCRKCNKLLTHIASLMSHERVHSRDSTVSFATKSSSLGYHDKLTKCDLTKHEKVHTRSLINVLYVENRFAGAHTAVISYCLLLRDSNYFLSKLRLECMWKIVCLCGSC